MKRVFNLKMTAKYFASFVAYFFITMADGKFSPLSVSLFTANVYIGLNPFLSLALYVAPFLLSFSLITIGVALLGGITVTAIFLIYKKYNKKPSIETALILAIALAPYCTLSKSYDLYVRLILSGVTVLSYFILLSACKVWLIKGLKYRISTDEFISASILYALVGYGVCASLGIKMWQAFGIFCILLSSSVLSSGITTIIACVTALPPCIVTGNFAPLGIFCICALVSSATFEYSKLLSSIAVILTQTALWLFTDVYKGDGTFEAILIVFPIILYLFIPNSFFIRLKEKLKIFKNNNLGRYSINRNRTQLSGKLYEISAVFDEMSASIENLEDVTQSEETTLSNMAEELSLKVCANCSARGKCRNRNFPNPDELIKIVSLGTAKGKMNLVDLPSDFSNICSYPEDIVAKTNSIIKQYETELDESRALSKGRELIAEQTKGVSRVLKDLAGEMSAQLQIMSELEKKISDNLYKCGICVQEVLVFSDDRTYEINIVIPKTALDKKYFLKAIEEVTGYKSAITAKTNLSYELVSVTLKKAPKFDAVFGIAQTTKSDKQKSGDTHSITKLSEGKFLIALNDGMGSGENAENSSSTAISLVETFYKAGLPSDTVLSTVNKILTFNERDDFTAMDIGIVDLFTGNADFIKIGSPYSFVITDDTVKIIEGNSLPLGILDEMKPTICKTSLCSGDVIVFMSDGISDAFGSSADLVEFLSSQRALNPKSLADNILERALFLSGGEANDDMTAFCVRIFEKAS